MDTEYYFKEQLNNDLDMLKSEFRQNRIKALPKIVNNEIVILFKNEKYLADIKKILEDNLENFKFMEREGELVLGYKQNAESILRRRLIRQTMEIISKRVDETGTREPIIQSQGENKIVVQVPGLENPDELKELLGTTAKLTFHLINENPTPKDNIIMLKDQSNSFDYPVEKRVLLNGELLNMANMIYDQGQPVINFKFNNLGAKKFADVTKNNVGRVLAIVLDDKVITAPRINTPILTGAGIISGNFTKEEASQVALLLRAGSLPAPLEIIEERTIGPTLGSELIKQGILSAVIGFILVVIFVLLIYKKLGVFAVLSLIVNMCIVLSLIYICNITLTLPGIAGLILTIGMAIDSNVLIFERLLEEQKMGKSITYTFNNAFDATITTITDSNVTTIIVGTMLYIFGTGPIKGFSVVLILGILSSIFSTLVFMKYVMFEWLLRMNIKQINI